MLPTQYIIDSIRALNGKPRVTFPGASSDVYKLELVVKEQRTTDWQTKYAYLSEYVETTKYPDAFLIERVILKEEAQWLEFYIVYHKLPGVILTAVSTDPETNEQVTTTRQLVKASDALPANANGIIWELEPVDDVVAIHVSRDLSALLGKTYEDYPEIPYTFPGILTVRGRTLSARTKPASYRPARSLLVKARRVLRYTVEAQNPQIFQWIGVNISADGNSYSDVLHDLRAVEIQGRRHQVQASYPSAKQYPRGQEVLIRAPSERGQNGLFRNEEINITLL